MEFQGIIQINKNGQFAEAFADGIGNTYKKGKMVVDQSFFWVVGWTFFNDIFLLILNTNYQFEQIENNFEALI